MWVFSPVMASSVTTNDDDKTSNLVISGSAAYFQAKNQLEKAECDFTYSHHSGLPLALGNRVRKN